MKFKFSIIYQQYKNLYGFSSPITITDSEPEHGQMIAYLDRFCNYPYSTQPILVEISDDVMFKHLLLDVSPDTFVVLNMCTNKIAFSDHLYNACSLTTEHNTHGGIASSVNGVSGIGGPVGSVGKTARAYPMSASTPALGSLTGLVGKNYSNNDFFSWDNFDDDDCIGEAKTEYLVSDTRYQELYDALKPYILYQLELYFNSFDTHSIDISINNSDNIYEFNIPYDFIHAVLAWLAFNNTELESTLIRNPHTYESYKGFCYNVFETIRNNVL